MAIARGSRILEGISTWLVPFFAGLLVGVTLAIAIFDPSVLRMRPTVDKPIVPPKPVPGTSVVDPLARDWDLNSDKVQWAPIIPLAQISSSAYSDEESLETILHEWGLTAFKPIEDGSSFGYVASNDSTVVIAFRGTNELIDWSTNLDLRPVKVANGSAHHGFYAASSKLSEEIFAAADHQGVSSKKLWITGHSLGGAMAVLFASECVNRGIEPAGLVTFGQPMLCDGRLARHLNSRLAGRYLRFVHGGDAVTRMVPPYCHCGNLVWFTEGTYRFERPLISVGATEDDTTTAEPIEYRLGPQPFSDAEFGDLVKPIHRRRQCRAAAARGVRGGGTGLPRILGRDR